MEPHSKTALKVMAILVLASIITFASAETYISDTVVKTTSWENVSINHSQVTDFNASALSIGNDTYVINSGDTMTGDLNMAQHSITSITCIQSRELNGTLNYGNLTGTPPAALTSTYNASYDEDYSSYMNGSLTSTYNISYVPYTGATSNVNLGVHSIKAQDVNASFISSLYNNSAMDIRADPWFIGGAGLMISGDFLPNMTLTYDLGSVIARWNAYLGDVSSDDITASGMINVTNAVYAAKFCFNAQCDDFENDTGRYWNNGADGYLYNNGSASFWK